MRYAFTSIWGAIMAATGWIALVSIPVTTIVFVIIAIRALGERYMQLAPALRGQVPWILEHPNTTLLAAALIGIFLGFLIGGPAIVMGQRLRIEVDSLNVQLAMLDQLEELARARDDREHGGRFQHLAGE